MPPIAAAFSAIAAGTAAIAEIATVISTVGIGLSVVGKITGNESLMKIGGVMGLVGGVTSFASGAGLLGAKVATEGILGGTKEESPIEESEATMEDLDRQISGMQTPKITDGQQTINVGEEKFLKPEFGSSGLLSSTQQPSPEYSGSMQASLDNAFIKSDKGYGAVTPPADTSSSGIKSWWGNLSPKDKSLYLQTGAGLIGGLYQGWTVEQKMAFERERAALAQQNANAQPIVSFQPVANVATRPIGGLLSARGA